MRISTKIITGYAILIGVMAALIVYQTFSARRMQSIVAKLSSADFRTARISLELMRDLDLVDEYARKSLALRDKDYAQQLKTYLQSFEREFGELQSAGNSGRRFTRLDGFARLWRQAREELAGSVQGTVDQWPAALPPALEGELEQLKRSLQEMHQAILMGIDSEVESSHRTASQTELVSLCAAGLALILSSLISFFIVRSITKPLRQLTAGTRAVAEGRFQCQLDASTQDEFAQVAQDFNSMARRLGELDALKKDFVSHVSHELKGPLASMQDNIRLLLDQLPGPLTEKQKRLLGLNLQSAQRLSSMIFNLLDISRMEAGAMQYKIEAHDLAEIVRMAVAESECKAGERRLSIRAIQPEPISVACDQDRMLQVVNNLLENAIKFSPGSGTIDVRTGRTSEMPEGIPSGWRARFQGRSARKEYVLLVVADRGPGVPDAHKERIFEKFHQTNKAAKVAGQGVGLGLAIARTIIDAHGGAIWVEDNPGGGSRFVVLLPSSQMQSRIGAVSAPI